MTEAFQGRLRTTLAARHDQIVDAWYRAIADTGYVPLSAGEVRARLDELFANATRLLLEKRFDRPAAEAIGRSLAEMHYLQPEAVGHTVDLFARELLADLPPEESVSLQPRLALLLGALVAGYFRRAYDTILTEQESIHQALVTELRTVELALRQAHDDLDARVQERTAELARANDELRAEIERRHQVEQAQRESEGRYRDLVDASPNGIFALQDGRYVFANPAGRNLLGYGPGELIGVLGFDTIHPDSVETVMDRIRRAQVGEPNLPVEMKVLRRDGSTLLTESTSVPITLNGEPAILIISQDISARKQAEAERIAMERRLLHAQKLESLGVLAGGIAHDFNNLLMAVLGNLDIAFQDLPPTSPARIGIESAVQACRRAVDLTRQMLAYSGKGHFVLTYLDLSDLVRENAYLFRASISRSVTMNIDLASDLPAVQADPGQVQQVVMNLITNASESIEDEVGVVTLSTGVLDCDETYLSHSRLDEKPPPGPFVYLEVSDTGCGMDADTQHRLFDPFFTTKFTGRGLGMAAVMGIVRGHGGAIMLDSQVGVGTTIWVLFPVAQVDEAAAAAPAREGAAAAHPEEESSLSGTVLVVDDEQHVRHVCRRILERLGFQVVTAADGQQALTRFEQEAGRFRCVLLDLTMPGMDGVATFHQLKRIRPDVKVILFSGYDESDAVHRFVGEGLAGFIQKPFGVQELQDKLEAILDGA